MPLEWLGGGEWQTKVLGWLWAVATGLGRYQQRGGAAAAAGDAAPEKMSVAEEAGEPLISLAASCRTSWAEV